MRLEVDLRCLTFHCRVDFETVAFGKSKKMNNWFNDLIFWFYMLLPFICLCISGSMLWILGWCCIGFEEAFGGRSS